MFRMNEFERENKQTRLQSYKCLRQRLRPCTGIASFISITEAKERKWLS